MAEDRPARTASTPNLLCRARPTVYLVGLIALFSMIPEGAVLDWAALYLRQELGTDLATAGFAFAGFSGAMATMRFLGDGVRNRFGAVTTLRCSSLIAAAGMCIGGLSPWPWLAIAAFAFCGFGIANMVPIAFSAGGNQPGMSSGTGMSVVTTMGYSGILMAPSAIGFVAEHTSFGPIFIALSALLVVVFLMAGLARTGRLRARSAAGIAFQFRKQKIGDAAHARAGANVAMHGEPHRQDGSTSPAGSSRPADRVRPAARWAKPMPLPARIASHKTIWLSVRKPNAWRSMLTPKAAKPWMISVARSKPIRSWASRSSGVSGRPRRSR